LKNSSADVAIVGLGLVGGSLARALRARGWRVAGLDTAEVRRRARRARVLDVPARTLAEAAQSAPLLVLAAPPAANRRLLAALARVAPEGLVVTDVGSVKAPIVAEAARRGLRFVGGHPMAGRARGGFRASAADLFQGHAWILTPGAADAGAVRAVRRMVRATGARVRVMDAAAHDRTMAFVSHLPQVVSYALAATAGRDRVARANLSAAGPAWRAMTRLAASPRPLWREILRENGPAVKDALQAFARALRRPL
jgi:prephenate dehydrogenase